MAQYTWDVFSTLDSYGTTEQWGGYWGNTAPEFLARRARLHEPDQLIDRPPIAATSRHHRWLNSVSAVG